MKRKIFLKYGIGGNLLIISILILSIGFLPNLAKIIQRNISDDYVQVSASIEEIKEVEDLHNVFIRYTMPDGKEYSSLLDTYVQGMAVGDQVEIFSHLDNPEIVTLKGNQFYQALLFGLLGGLLLIIALFLIRKHKHKKEKI